MPAAGGVRRRAVAHQPAHRDPRHHPRRPLRLLRLLRRPHPEPRPVLATSGPFDQAITAVPITLPSHTSIMTGTYPVFHGVHDNDGYRVDDGVSTLAEILLQAGGFTDRRVRWGPTHSIPSSTWTRGSPATTTTSSGTGRRPRTGHERLSRSASSSASRTGSTWRLRRWLERPRTRNASSPGSTTSTPTSPTTPPGPTTPSSPTVPTTARSRSWTRASGSCSGCSRRTGVLDRTTSTSWSATTARASSSTAS